ncbi:psbP domain-containing protein 5, chloroplastic-like [Salvia hispanica]|uniref:psbP domain-containing protein 5, chloroplastic-like n=1 Tax=Salvia hispanica TaxID=49212 RepID=UPI00200953D2|nr:psbP domain-containing protein 5, chloroplastic-like [Salvia hispanica]
MAVAALPTLKYHHSLSPSFVIFGNNAQSMPISRNRKAQLSGKSRKIVGCSSNPSRPCLQDGILRRDLMFLGLSSSLSLAFPVLGAGAEEELKMDLFVDETNAYSYLYPKALPSDKFVFKWVESRKPERYSSAAPLSPDARLRIVSERVDFIDNLIISVSIGPLIHCS